MINFKFRGDAPQKADEENAMTPIVNGNSEIREQDITTVIADDLDIKGTIRFKSSLMIKGTLEGEIVSEGLLIVGLTAKVAATITTKNLISYGEITGDVAASERVVLKESAVHTGNITTPNIVIESGSVFNGSCIMRKESAGQTTEDLPTYPSFADEQKSVDESQKTPQDPDSENAF